MSNFILTINVRLKGENADTFIVTSMEVKLGGETTYNFNDLWKIFEEEARNRFLRFDHIVNFKVIKEVREKSPIPIGKMVIKKNKSL